MILMIYGIVVADTTKVRIFKQITTPLCTCADASQLLLIPQRYEFSSKSQLAVGNALSADCCCWYHKGTNFQANHNNVVQHAKLRSVVADTTKVRIFKQITTLCSLTVLIDELLLIPQRYEFSSKSQPDGTETSVPIGCCWYHKGTNFQANHNTQKRKTTNKTLLLIPQRYEFSSKSQPNKKSWWN